MRFKTVVITSINPIGAMNSFLPPNVESTRSQVLSRPSIVIECEPASYLTETFSTHPFTTGLSPITTRAFCPVVIGKDIVLAAVASKLNVLATASIERLTVIEVNPS